MLKYDRQGYPHFVESIKAITIVSQGLHTCDANWGWCGEHMAYTATYVCPECGHKFTLHQCAAWPIQQTQCPNCFFESDWEIPDGAVRERLR